MEADLHRFYGLDLADLLRRGEWMKVHRLVRNLPPGAATHRAIFADQAPWDVEHHLLADVVDILNAANWQRAQSKTAPKPKPVPRPDPRKALRQAAGGDKATRVAARRAAFERQRQAQLTE